MKKRFLALLLSAALCISGSGFVVMAQSINPPESAASDTSNTSTKSDTNEIPSESQTQFQETGDSNETTTQIQETEDSNETPAQTQETEDSNETTTQIQETEDSSEPPDQFQETEDSIETPDQTQETEDSNEPPTQAPGLSDTMADGVKALSIQPYAAPPQSSLTGISTILASTTFDSLSWPGSGTAADPKVQSGTSTRDVFVAITEDDEATINGVKYHYEHPLQYGINTFNLTVVSSDGTVTTYYRVTVTREKLNQPNTPSVYDFSIIPASTDSSADGGIVGFMPALKYDYQKEGTNDWLPVPDNAGEATGLTAGTYKIRYGETDTMKAGTADKTITVTIPVAAPKNITIGTYIANNQLPGLETIFGKPVTLNVPPTATPGENVTISTVLPIPDVVITKITWSGTNIYEDSLYGLCKVSPNPGGDYLYQFTFQMPDNENVTLKEIFYTQGSFYTVNLDSQHKSVLNMRVDSINTTDWIQNGKQDYYKGNSKVRISVSLVAKDSYTFNEIAAYDSTGQKLHSNKGNILEVNIDSDFIIKVDMTPNPADLTQWDALLTQLPADLTLLDLPSRQKIRKLLLMDPVLRTLLKSDHLSVDYNVQQLQNAINTMRYRSASVDVINTQLQRIPADLSIFTTDTVAALNTAKTNAMVPINDQWDIRRQSEVDALADQLKAAIDALAKIPAPTPGAPELLDKTDTSITVKAVAGQEYSIDGGQNWVSNGIFTGLLPASDYKIITRVTETATSDLSAASAPLTVTTDKSTPAAPKAPVIKTVTEDSITVETVKGQEYSIDGGSSWQDDGKFTGLKGNTGYSIITRIKATDTTYASPASKVLAVSTADVPESESQTETETESESESETQTESESETETESEPVTESESESQTESETESESQSETTKAPPSGTAKTGDNTPVAITLGIMGISLTGIVVSLVFGKRKKHAK